MNTNSRIEEIKRYRLKQADEAVAAAKLLLENEQVSAALNRVYYGMFYAVTALALMKGFKTSKHQQLLGWFNKEIVSTGLVMKEIGVYVRAAFNARMESDYEALVEYSVEDVQSMIPKMEQFIMEIKRLLGEV